MSVKLYKLYSWPLPNLPSKPLEFSVVCRFGHLLLLLHSHEVWLWMHQTWSAGRKQEQSCVRVGEQRRSLKTGNWHLHLEQQLLKGRQSPQRRRTPRVRRVWPVRCGIFLQCCAKSGYNEDHRHPSRSSSLCRNPL
jgi:hypothetical protein